MTQTFLILGGYGNTGRLIAEYLLQETDVNLVLAGRNSETAQCLADTFNQQHGGRRVSAMRVNASNVYSLKHAFEQVNFVVVAASTMKYAALIARAAVAARIDYLDTQLSSPDKIKTLQAMRSEIERAGCCFITDGGFHPGLPAALVRYAASRLDRLERANVASVIQINWKLLSFSEATMTEMIEEFKSFQPLVFKDRNWLEQGWNSYQKFDFGPEFGQRPCVPMFMEELRTLPEEIPTLRETGFFVGGFNWFTDYVFMPAAFAALKLAPHRSVKSLGRLFGWSLNTFSRPPYGIVLLLEASGQQAGQPAVLRLALSHPDGYVLTAVPIVACLLQYLAGDIKRPGLWFQANVIDPEKMLRDVKRLGVNLAITSSSASPAVGKE